MVTENLTPGGKLAEYSDGELFRVLRHGLNQDGDLLAFMPLLPYAQLSDADTEAIIAYLRSLPPVETTHRRWTTSSLWGRYFTGRACLAHRTRASTILSPKSTTAEYGKYVATFGECRGCHGRT